MRILVVDDERSNLDEISKIFEDVDLDIEGVFCNNPVKALEIAKKEKFDAMFLDIQMPVMTGIDLAEIVLDEKQNLDVVFITAYNHYAAEAFEVNAIDYILKPIRLERVKRALDKIIERKKGDGLKKGSKYLKIITFGCLKVFSDEHEVNFCRGKSKELFLYLFINRGKLIHKDLLCEKLWSEMDNARALANLQVTVCRLRKELEAFSREQISIYYDDNTYRLMIKGSYIDIDEFEKYLELGTIQGIEKAISIYNGSFLAKEEWVWQEGLRQRLRDKYIEAVQVLAVNYIDNHKYSKAKDLLIDYWVKEPPEVKLCNLFLKVGFLTKKEQGLNEAYSEILQKYKEVLEIDIPREIKREHTRILKNLSL